MAEPLEIDPTISKLIQLIEQKDNAFGKFKSRIDGVGTVVKSLLEKPNGNVIETQMKITGCSDNDELENNVDKISNQIIMIEERLVHVLKHK